MVHSPAGGPDLAVFFGLSGVEHRTGSIVKTLGLSPLRLGSHRGEPMFLWNIAGLSTFLCGKEKWTRVIFGKKKVDTVIVAEKPT